MAIKTPPAMYGGLERLIVEYAKGLAQLGHDVAMVVAKGSDKIPSVESIETTKAWNELVPAEQQMYSRNDGIDREFRGLTWKGRTWNGWREQERVSYEMYKDLINGFDVIGDHSWAKWSYASKKEEIIGTCHSIKSYNIRPPRPHPLMTGVSHGHARFISKELHIPCRALQNPTDLNLYKFVKDKSERILSLNRIMPQKGIHLFVDLVEKERLRADIAGDDSQLVQDQGYVQAIKNKCKNSAFANYYGLVDEPTRLKLLREAKCLVCLKDFGYEEVFGLSAVEALASGTPVIALKTWGFSDIIQNGENGFLCENMEEVAKSIQKVNEIKSEACRESVQKYSTEVRSKAYEQMFIQVKSGNRW